MNSLELLTARERLMDDINSIIELNFLTEYPLDVRDDIFDQLRVAVCKHFPLRDTPIQPSKRTTQVKIMLDDTELAWLEDKASLNQSNRAREFRRLIHQRMIEGY